MPDIRLAVQDFHCFRGRQHDCNLQNIFHKGSQRREKFQEFQHNKSYKHQQLALAQKKASVAVPIHQASVNCRNFSRDSPKPKEGHDKIIEFMALDDQPISMVEDQGFCYWGIWSPGLLCQATATLQTYVCLSCMRCSAHTFTV